MDFKLSFPINESIFLKNPEHSELGKKIVKNSIDLINEMGFEKFTFKKLSQEVGTTEATVYRYFENKHKLLIYILSWYWFYIDFLIEFQILNIQSAEQKLLKIIYILTHELPSSSSQLDYDKQNINNIVNAEGSKVYLIKDVDEINQNKVYKPFKDLCARISEIIIDYNKNYKYPNSLSSTIIETAHDQQFFADHLPRLTDVTAKNKKEFTYNYLKDLVFKILN